MSRFDEIIARLPGAARPLAELYASIFERWTQDEVNSWLRIALTNGWQIAYSQIVAKMTTDEIANEQRRTNEMLYRLNSDNAAVVDAQRQAIVELAFALLR